MKETIFTLYMFLKKHFRDKVIRAVKILNQKRKSHFLKMGRDERQILS